MGRPQPDVGSAGQGIDRDRLDVHARDGSAGEGRGDRGAHQIGCRLRRKINKALPNAAITLDTIAQALAAFERTLEPGRAAFDRWIEGDEQAISESAKRGFVLFNGKANCFACHGGWRFTDDRFHDIGVATTDRGRGRDVKDDELMQFAFKTPTLRSVALRPPFMHDGSVPSLYDVMRLYEKGGIDRPSRSPMMLPLTMTEQERLDLVAFLETLTGAIDEARAKQ